MTYTIDILIRDDRDVLHSEKRFYKDRDLMFNEFCGFVDYLENEYYKGRIKEFNVSIDIIAIE